ncbi:MAG: YjbQ family protein [Deltaproteobacteria bacterium]|jgi:secondary thiamine-phosphate synthase enzyme|nr:YjbQ family protein [Deltaproteobacteria bacterium]
MKSYLKTISIDTKKPMEFIDITDAVKSAFGESEIREGLLNVYSNHTTASVTIAEKCEKLQKDMEEFLENAVPSGTYLHDEDTIDGRPNGRMHLMALYMNASETVPVSSGEMMLGQWQSIFFAELDGPREGRKVFVKVIGS